MRPDGQAEFRLHPNGIDTIFSAFTWIPAALAFPPVSAYASLTMRTLGILTLAGLAAILGACGGAPAVDKVAVEKSVTAVESAMLKAAGNKDAAAFASNYADNAIVMLPGAQSVRGLDAIRTALKAMAADPNFKLDFASDRVEVADAGDMAATRGSYELTESDPATKQPVTDKGSYVTVFRKQQDGAWKAVLDISTSEKPAKAPAAAPAGRPSPSAAKEKPKTGKKGRKR
jgi:uncharacterized protein (TIGR02246 family)